MSIETPLRQEIQRVGDSRWWGSETRVTAGNKAKRLSSVKHTTKTIHRHHHHHHLEYRGNVFLNGSLCFPWQFHCNSYTLQPSSAVPAYSALFTKRCSLCLFWRNSPNSKKKTVVEIFFSKIVGLQYPDLLRWNLIMSVFLEMTEVIFWVVFGNSYYIES